MQRGQGQAELTRQAVGDSDNALMLQQDFSVDFWYAQRHCGVETKGTAAIDHYGPRAHRVRRIGRAGLGIGRKQGQLHPAQGVLRERADDVVLAAKFYPRASRAS